MKKNDVLALIIAAAAFVIFAVLLKFNIIIAAIITVLIYFGLSFLLKPKEKIGNVDVEEIANGEKLKGEFDNAKEDIAKIQRMGVASGVQEISLGANQLARTGTNIITYLSEHIDRVPKAKQFLNYYLDTAVEILEKYASLRKNNAPADEMKRVTGETLSAVKTLQGAFDDQYRKLLDGDVMDIESDIKVLHDTTKMDGVKNEVEN